MTRKITRAAVRIAAGQQEKLFLGNLNAKRDWGHAKDYVRGMWQMLQQKIPEDFILATGETTTVRTFCEMAFKHAGIEIEWKGEDENEIGIDKKSEMKIIEVDPQYFRPTEVESLLGDAKKAKEILGWETEYSVEELVEDMTEKDREQVEGLEKTF